MPTAAANAVALIVPIPGIDVSRRMHCVVPCHPDELPVKSRNPLVEGTPFGSQVFDQNPNSRAERLDPAFIGKGRKRLLQLASALRHHDPALQQQSPQMVDQRRPLRHQAFACPMQRLDVRLRLGS